MLGALPAGIWLPGRKQIYCGWRSNPGARAQFIQNTKAPFFKQLDHSIRGSSDGRVVMLHPFMERATGHPTVPHKQGIGDCVGHGYALGVDMLTGVQMFMQQRPERWVAECATEPLYAGSRVEIGGGVLMGDGSQGAWAAEWLIKYGALLRQEYPGGHDYTVYDAKKARKMGRQGVPDELEPIAKLHPIKTATLVNDFDELCDAIANGYPVTLCSDVGFGMTSSQWVRDSQGYLRRRGSWGHCMLAIGFDKKSSRKGACIQNSWGNWVSGPTQHGQPEGSFWTDARVINSMLRQGDSHALSGYIGYPRVDVPDYEIW